MAAPMVISWTVTDGDPPRVHYTVDGAAAGRNGHGFDAVLEAIRRDADRAVVLRVGTMPTGGQALLASLPFHERLAELEAALDGRKLVYTIG